MLIASIFCSDVIEKSKKNLSFFIIATFFMGLYSLTSASAQIANDGVQDPFRLFNNNTPTDKPAQQRPPQAPAQSSPLPLTTQQNAPASRVKPKAPSAKPKQNNAQAKKRSGRRDPINFQQKMIRNVNRNVIGLISGTTNGTYISIASDISQVLDRGDDLRIIPIAGKGGAQNIRDLLFLRGIDMAIVQSDTREVFSKDDNFRPLLRNLRYISKLYNEELHVFAHKDITSLRDLDGKRVNISDVGSGTNVSMRRVFEQMRIQPQLVNMGQLDAYEAMKNGALDATILIAGKPSGAFSRFARLDDHHIVPIELSDINSNHFVPSVLTSKEYPNLIEEGESLNTVAVEAILIAYEWPKGNDRRRRVDAFIESFFENIDEFRKAPRHPKWQETNIAAEVPLWERMARAESLLKEMKRDTQKSSFNAPMSEAFRTFLAVNQEKPVDTLTREEKNALYGQFLIWQKQQ